MALTWAENYPGYKNIKLDVVARLCDAPWKPLGVNQDHSWAHFKEVPLDDLTVPLPGARAHQEYVADILNEALRRMKYPEDDAHAFPSFKAARHTMNGTMELFLKPGRELDFGQFERNVQEVLAERKAIEEADRGRVMQQFVSEKGGKPITP